jgi:hypothetical protein
MTSDLNKNAVCMNYRNGNLSLGLDSSLDLLVITLYQLIN